MRLKDKISSVIGAGIPVHRDDDGGLPLGLNFSVRTGAKISYKSPHRSIDRSRTGRILSEVFMQYSRAGNNYGLQIKYLL